MRGGGLGERQTFKSSRGRVIRQRERGTDATVKTFKEIQEENRPVYEGIQWVWGFQDGKKTEPWILQG